jgi:hypothetical protein
VVWEGSGREACPYPDFWVGAPSMLMVQPTHVMRIKPLNHSFSRAIAHVTSHEHEPDGQQDRQADHKANH